MSISRRQFIVGSAAATAGVILPSFADQVLGYVELTGEPLLEVPKTPDLIFHALPNNEGGYSLLDTSVEFSIEPPPTTWRQFFEFEGVTIEEGMEAWNVGPRDLDQEAAEEYVWYQWSASRSPTAQAFWRLDGYQDQLGPELVGDENELGHLDFVEGPHPGSSDCWVDVSGPVGLSCLQHRLDALELGINLEVAPKGLY